MKNNILVMGNGFDIAHGLPTKYSDFINYVRKYKDWKPSNMDANPDMEEFCKIVRNNGFIASFLNIEREVPGWIDFEKEIGNIVSIFADLFKGKKQLLSSNGSIPFEKLNTLWKLTMYYFDLCYRGEACARFTTNYYSPIYGLKEKCIKEKLCKDLDDLIRALQLYFQVLMKIEHPDTFGKELKKIKLIEQIDPFYVISFNYTDTYTIYNIPEENVFHVHGSLKKNNMVLGINDDDPDNLDFIFFKKYFQRIQKLTGYIDIPNTFDYDEGIQIKRPDIHFYGHSLDKTDEDIINSLFNKSQKFIIYYLSPEDYAQKVVNLIDIFGKEDATSYFQKKQIEFVEIVK